MDREQNQVVWELRGIATSDTVRVCVGDVISTRVCRSPTTLAVGAGAFGAARDCGWKPVKYTFDQPDVYTTVISLPASAKVTWPLGITARVVSCSATKELAAKHGQTPLAPSRDDVLRDAIADVPEGVTRDAWRAFCAYAVEKHDGTERLFELRNDLAQYERIRMAILRGGRVG